jgi:hypothetical protein
VCLLDGNTAGLHWLLSGVLFPWGLCGGEGRKEGFKGVTMRQCLNTTMPLIHPVVPTATLTLFLPMYTGNREITPRTPAQGPSQGLPKLRIEQRFLHGHHEGRLVVGSRPRRVFIVGANVGGFYALRVIDVVSSFDGFVHGFLDRHGFSLFLGVLCTSCMRKLISF